MSNRDRGTKSLKSATTSGLGDTTLQSDELAVFAARVFFRLGPFPSADAQLTLSTMRASAGRDLAEHSTPLLFDNRLSSSRIPGSPRC